MAVHNKVHNNVSVSASGSSQVFRNFGQKKWMLTVIVNGTPTGTTPTLTYAVQVSSDGTNFSNKGGALAAITAAGAQRTIYAPGSTQGQITEPYVKVTWAAGGTAPVFPGVTATLHSLNC